MGAPPPAPDAPQGSPPGAAAPDPGLALALIGALALAAAADLVGPRFAWGGGWGSVAILAIAGCAALAPALRPLLLPACIAAVPLLAAGGRSWWASAAAAIVAVAAACWPLVAARWRQPAPSAPARAHDALRDRERERDHLGEHLDRYAALQEACLELAGARDLRHLAGALCRRARALAPEAREVQVFLGHGGELACLASADAADASCPRGPGPAERYVAAEARPLTVRGDDGVRALLPLRGDRRRDGDADALRGVLAVRLDASPEHERLVLELLAALARLGGLGVAAVDLLEQARTLALRDDLTGLYGRHEFLRRLHEQVASVRRGGAPLGLVVCDMDHLKRYNDRWGHPAGDRALKAVAAALTACFGDEAIVCRWGGEEFAALLPGADAATTADAAERARAAIAGCRPEPEDPQRRVTASVGWTVLHREEPGTAALTRADAACYRAKAGGRNRTEGEP